VKGIVADGNTGKRLIVVQIQRLGCKSGSMNGYYDGQINSYDFEKWLKEKSQTYQETKGMALFFMLQVVL
jgi:hypothetical protein